MSGSSLAPGHTKRSRTSDARRTEKDRTKRRRFSKGALDVTEDVQLAAKGKATEDNTQDATSTQDTSAHAREQQTKFSRENWCLSSPVAGQYSNLDPIITSDEEYLLVGTETAIHVHSIGTSYRSRTLQLKDGQKVVGYNICSENPRHLYIITSTGCVSKWDWLSGDQIASWALARETLLAELCPSEVGKLRYELLFSLRGRKDGKRQLTVTLFNGGTPRDIVVFETTQRIDNFRVFRQGQAIVAWAGQRLLLGTREFITRDPSTMQYAWREVVLPVRVTCIDVRESRARNRTIPQGSQDNNLDTMDLVLGESGGSILIYPDFFALFPTGGIGSDDSKGLAPRRLHWHRGPVNAVRWSKDGNYIISGGDESVMVLWQLDTGRKQFLPHLSSPICNIVVSTTGKAYIVKLADNCIMVLSATELQPYVTITGLQLCPKVNKPADAALSESRISFQSPAAVLHPQFHDRLLVAVPASRHAARDYHPTTSSCVLQTYDIRTNSQISRQALARTNATTLRISPEGTEIVAPDVSHLDICQDGKWMATIDDWIPRPEDIRALEPNSTSTGSHTLYRETYLKFWRWDEVSNMWELATRINSPHSFDSVSVPILDLASRPYSHEFATVGCDAVLRFWCASNRPRLGLATKRPEHQYQTWKCRGTIDLKGEFIGGGTEPASAACMGFSEDGSVLAVCVQTRSSPDSGLVILLDMQNCKIHHSRVGVYSGRPCAARFLGRYLVVLSLHSAHIWDTVGDIVRTTSSSAVQDNTPCGDQLLAVSSKSQTCAVASKVPRHLTGTRRTCGSQFDIRVYDVQTLSLLTRQSLKHCPVSLLSDPLTGDYIVVDAMANVQRLSCSDKAPQLIPQSKDGTSHNYGLGGLFGTRSRDMSRHGNLQPLPVSGSSSAPQSSGLPGVFTDNPPFVLPPTSVLFKSLVQNLTT
jgi:NET1-associated nuclear protein 1 (U3 small nucleolar RNA-associated protein 17)